MHQITLQLKWKHQFQFAGYYIAKEKGFYKEEGLEVTIRPHDGVRSPVEVLLSGDADYAITGSDIVIHRAKGEPLVALAAIFQHSAYGFLVRADSGIERVEDFKGHKVMLGSGIQDLSLKAAIEKAGLKATDYIRQISSQDINSLIRGDTDVFNAYITDQKYRLDQQGIESRYILPINYGIDFYGDVLATTEQEIILHNNRLEKFLRASLKGWKYALEHQDEAIDLILKKYNSQNMGYQHLEYEAHATRELIQPMLVAMGHMNPARWENIRETLADIGMVDSNSSINGMIYSRKQSENLISKWFSKHGLTLLLGSLIIYVIILLLLLLKMHSKNRAITQELAESKQRLQDSQEHAKIGNWEILEGQDKELWSEQVYKIFGLEPGSSSCHQSLRTLMRSEEYQALEESLKKSRENWVEHHMEYRITPPGSDERWIECRGVPVFNSQGKPKKISGFIQDITNRKLIEEELRTERDFAENIINMAQAIVLVLDSNGRIVRFNPYMETISGYSLQELKGKEWFDTFLPDEDKDKIRALFLAAINDIDTSGNINPIITKHGEIRDIEWFNKTLFDAEENVIGLLCIGHDITERINAVEKQNRLQNELQHAHKMEAMGELTGGVAHDFNNILGIIIGNLDALRDEVIGNSPAVRHSEAAMKAALRGSDLTRRLLTFSSKTTPNRSPQNINHVITGLLKILERSITSSIQVNTMFSAGIWNTNINPGDLEDALINLAANARDAMPNGGQLTIHTRNATIEEGELPKHADIGPGEYVEITLEDTGDGIPKEIIERIFEPFFTTKSVGKGTGLGLSIVYRFIKSVDGYIDITSEHGQGTKVRILLPRCNAIRKKDFEQKTKSASLAKGVGTILIVDDEEELAISTKTLLNRAGYQAMTAFDGNQALVALQTNPGISLIITDVVMTGGMNGFELAREAKRLYPNIKVVIASGYVSRLDREEFGEYSDKILHKPYRTEEMLACIQKHLDETG